MEPEFEFALRLPERGSRRLLHALHEQVRAAILDGRLKPGARLPATRTFAADYGVSRNTAVALYDLLLSEGYLVAHGKAGTRVADVLPKAPRREHAASARAAQRLTEFWRRQAPRAPRMPSARFDFRLGIPEQTRFPFALWQRLSARVLRAYAKAPTSYADAQGQFTLRDAIARHVSFTRAVACSADDVIVTAGAQQAFDLLARVLVTPSSATVAMENPGYPPLRRAFLSAGANVVAVPVDAEGIRVEHIPRDACAICVTPSHQFPLGMVLSARRRAALLDFAQAHGAVVIEDDYDGEFRFGGRPLDALQTLDLNANVFYVGTFSKCLFPALRLGFIVAPAWAQAALVAARQNADWHSPILAQDTLAAFISEGHLLRHVRKMRKLYATRRELLLEILERDFARWLEPVPGAAGLHLAALARGTLDVDAIAARAREHDVGVYPLRAYHTGRSARSGLAFGYGAIDVSAIEQGLARLRRVVPR
jgi:GntR family transcriptional regulator/MocR family aminotransferase